MSAKRQRRPRTVRTLADLRDAFQTGTIDKRYWTLCIDSGGCFLRYIGPNKDGMEPALPVELALSPSPWELIDEACRLAGIQSERA